MVILLSAPHLHNTSSLGNCASNSHFCLTLHDFKMFAIIIISTGCVYPDRCVGQHLSDIRGTKWFTLCKWGLIKFQCNSLMRHSNLKTLPGSLWTSQSQTAIDTNENTSKSKKTVQTGSKINSCLDYANQQTYCKAKKSQIRRDSFRHRKSQFHYKLCTAEQISDVESLDSVTKCAL